MQFSSHFPRARELARENKNEKKVSPSTRLLAEWKFQFIFILCTMWIFFLAVYYEAVKIINIKDNKDGLYSFED
jgi:hypothetical protein